VRLVGLAQDGPHVLNAPRVPAEAEAVLVEWLVERRSL
jgi:hypothetical protein